MGRQNDISTEESFVLDFIYGQREPIITPQITEKEEETVELAFNQIVDAVLKDFAKEVPLRLVLCQSCTKYSSIQSISVKGNKFIYYLVYDLHLNHINRIINAIYFSSNDPEHDLWKLSYELFAEESIMASNRLLSTYYGLNKIALGPFETAINKSTEDLDFIYLIQEKYIIAHEIGHWIYSLSKQEDLRDILNVSTDLSALTTEIKEILKEVYDRLSVDYQNSDYSELISEQSTIIDNEALIVEECLADAVAYSFVFSYVVDEYRKDTNKKLMAAQALLLEMLNLQILAMHHMTVCEKSFENMTSIRVSFFRNYVNLFFDDNKESFYSIFNQTVNRYEHRITAPILNCFNTLEQRYSNLVTAIINEDGTYNGKQILGLVDP